MKYEPTKVYSHPVLRHGSSDCEGNFHIETTVEKTAIAEVEVQIQFILSNSTLEDLIQENRAEFALIVRSPLTFFREAIVGTESNVTKRYANGVLFGRLELYPFIFAKQELNNLESDTWHKDYTEMRFDIAAGSVLAVGLPIFYFIDFAEESAVASIFTLSENSELGAGMWQLIYGEDLEQVTIEMSEGDYARTNQNRKKSSDKEANEVLLNAIYFPALVSLLQEVDQQVSDSGGNNFEDCRWFRSIESKLNKLNCKSLGSVGSDRLLDAQKIFEFPFRNLQLEFDE